MASDIRERFHDPVINRRILIQEIVAFVVDYVKPYQTIGIQSEHQLQELQNTIEMDVYKYAVRSGMWTERELPLRVKLYYQNNKMHMDFNGPMGGEVFVAMTAYLDFKTPIGPVGGYAGDDEEDDDDEEVEGGFRYGR